MLETVLAYINNHLEENISLDELAKITGYSPYYLHRKLKEELQEPIGNFIIKQRIQAATYLLTLTDLPVSEIRLLVGYDNDSAFSRVFKSTIGITPRAFRKQQNLNLISLPAAPYISLKCEVVWLPEQKAVVFPCVGNYFNPDIYRVWDKAAAFMQEEELAPENFNYYGVLYDCQNVNKESLCRYGAAIVGKPNTHLPASKHFVTTLPGGKFAKYKFCCPIADYAKVGSLINEHLHTEMKLKHKEGTSYFQFQSLPSFAMADNLFITWFIPIN
ncbi:MAG: AraC family transcriptional regulator [Bacteroidota bacterium]|nr:AraC family transcriptional regulator [Bacteroidota bacterium]